MGPNGAGKTTLLRVLAGLIKATSGTLTGVDGVDLVGHDSMVYDALTPRENLEFFLKLRGLPTENRVVDILETVGLAHVADQRVGSFSRGMKQRIAIGRALLGEADLLLLDEPFTGLDQDGVKTVTRVVRERREQGCAVVVVSHDLPRSVPLVSHVLFLVGGAGVGPEPIGEDVPAVSRRYAEVVRDA